MEALAVDPVSDLGEPLEPFLLVAQGFCWRDLLAARLLATQHS